MSEKHPLSRVFKFKQAMFFVSLVGIPSAVALLGPYVKDILFQKGGDDDNDDDVGGSSIEGHDDSHPLERLRPVGSSLSDLREWIESPAGIITVSLAVVLAYIVLNRRSPRHA